MSNLLKNLIVSFLFLQLPSAYSINVEYKEVKVGCFSPLKQMVKFDCREDVLEFEVLKNLHFSKRPKAKEELESSITNRAKYFLDKKKYDYFSVMSLMVFPIVDKTKWLNEFMKLPGKRAPFTAIAIERVEKKKSKLCPKGEIPFHLKEICSITIY